MQIFKHFLLAGSIALALSPVCLRAEDTEAQAQARAALQQKMREMGGQPPADVAPPASQIKTATPPVTPAAPAQKQTPRPVQVPASRRSSPGQPPITQPAATPAPMDSAKAPGTAPVSPAPIMVAPNASSPDLIEQARQATRAKMAELQSQQNNAAAQPVFQPVPTTATKAAPPVVTAGKPAQPSKAEIQAAKERDAAAAKAAQQKADQEKAAAKKAAAQQAKIAADQEKAEAAKAAKTSTKPAKVEKIEAAPATFTPLTAPASSLPASKEQRLQALLDQYKADKITAEEYHDQRAKIIAEP